MGKYYVSFIVREFDSKNKRAILYKAHLDHVVQFWSLYPRTDVIAIATIFPNDTVGGSRVVGMWGAEGTDAVGRATASVLRDPSSSQT